MGSASASASPLVAERLGALGVKTPSVSQDVVSPVFYGSFTPTVSGVGGPTLLWNCYPSITVGLAPAAWLWASPTGYTHNAPSVAWMPRPLVPANPGAPPSVACQLLVLLPSPHTTWAPWLWPLWPPAVLRGTASGLHFGATTCARLPRQFGVRALVHI